MFGVAADSDVYVKEVVTPWDQNSKEITYIGADNSVIGYANTYSYVDGQGSSSGTSYFSADWNWLGDVSSSSGITALGLRHALTLRMPMAVGPRLVLKAMVRLRVSLNVTLTQVETSLVALRLENGVTYALDENWMRSVFVDPTKLSQFARDR